MLLDRLCSGFLLDCQVRNLSRVTTERNYRPILERLTDFLCNPPVMEIETHDLKKFVLSLQANDPKPWTLYTYIRAVKRLLRWANEEGVLDGNPAAPLKYPRIPRRQTEIFSPGEIDLLLTGAKEMSYRDYAIGDLELRAREMALNQDGPMLRFLLQAHRPEVYAQKMQTAMTAPGRNDVCPGVSPTVRTMWSTDRF